MERLFNFIGGDSGDWFITGVKPVIGESLPGAERLAIVGGETRIPAGGLWSLRGVVSNERYVTHAEREELRATQAGLGRQQASRAALIPIRKSAAWWALAQDERRAIVEDQSRHIRTGMKYLPAVARRLHHSRDLGEPFDFLTWFEYAPGDEAAFEELVGLLRLTEEWKFVDREVDIRLARA
ncbi:MAG TPA: chlorite dismutase family protein [Fibrobacteria bacterium]|nr:chlorite dismutase family protein [Fibrobacteria bacterium]